MRPLIMLLLLLAGCSSSGDSGAPDAANGDASRCGMPSPGDVPTSGMTLSGTPGSRATLPAINDGDTTFWRVGSCLYVATTGMIAVGQVTAHTIDGGTLQIAADVSDEVSFTVTWVNGGQTCSASFIFHDAAGEVESLGGFCSG